MMERSREARRGSMAAVNGGLSRRRQQRSSNLRDSPEEDGVTEMQETSRLRDREWGSKKDRERDRDRDRSSSRSKRRRGERLGEDSSEESIYEEDDDDEDASVSVRFPASAAVNPPPSSSSSSMHQSQNHHVRRSFSSKPARPPVPAWKVAEEMIGVSIPRKARSSSLKRSQEGGGGGCGGGSGELIHQQASTSPARQSPLRNTALSPSSSNVSVCKKKPISGLKHRPPKISKSSSIQEIEIEVAEVLFGMTRQVPLLQSSSRQEPNHKLELKDTNGFSSEAKSRVSSPASSFSPPPTTSQPSGLVATAPKRKRPRPKSPAMKVEMEIPPKAKEGLASASPSRSEKKLAVSTLAVENGGITSALADMDVAGAVAGSSKQENSNHEVKVENATMVSKSKEASSSVMDAHLDEANGPIYSVPAAAVGKTESPREEKYSIDLMASPPAPPGNSEKEGLPEYAADNALEPAKEIVGSIYLDGEIEKPDKSAKHDAMAEERNVGKLKFMPSDLHVTQNVEKEKPDLDLQLDLEKQDRDSLSLGCSSSSKHQQQMKQQSKVPRVDAKQEKNVAHPASLPLTIPVAGWPGSFPHFGYMGQVPSLPAVMPMDGSSVTAKTMQPPHFFPPQKPKRCATHCYIAQTIHYNQQIARMNPFWPPAAAAAVAAAAGTPPIYGAKPCNLNIIPSSEAAVLGNPLQGGFPGRSLGPLQDKASSVTITYTGTPAKEKSSATAAVNSTLMEAHRKQFLLQQAPQPGSSAAPPNMLHGPAFIFPIGQQQAAAATRSAAAKSALNATPNAVSASSVAAYSEQAGHPVTTTMSFNYAGLQPNDAQYLAILQNNGYPFSIPAHVGGSPSPYRGANPSQAMPFFNGSFYSSPMLHPSAQQQLRQQQQLSTHQQSLAHSQQGHQNTSTSSGSSSSQKHHSQQSQRVPGGGRTAAATAGGNSHGFPASKSHLHLLPPQARQLETETGCEDSPSTADSSRASQAHKNMYGNFAMSIHPQNFALISPAAAALPSSSLGGGGGSHKDKQQPLQNQANLTPSQAYAMSFAPFGGLAAAGSAQGIDFSSMVPNHALFQSLPEAARHHGYQQMAVAATGVATAAVHATQHKKPHNEDGKLGGDRGAVKANVSEEGKMMVSTGKPLSSSAQHSLSFSRPDNDPPISTFAINNSSITEGPSRTLNLIQPPANDGRAANRPSSAAPASSSAAATAANPTASSLHMQPSQQQQHLIQLQKQHQHQHQQQLLLQQQMSSRVMKTSSPHSTNNVAIYSDRIPSGSTATRIPQGALAGFPPSIIQGASGTQSPQWKASGRAATPGPSNSATASAKNQLTQHQQQQLQQQQQGRTQQQYQQSLLSSNAHQAQISFGVSSSKTASVSGSNNSMLTPAAAAVASGPPQNSVSKTSIGNGGGSNGSPHASSSSKSGPPAATLLSPSPSLQQQMPAGKNSSSSSSNLKSSPANTRNSSSNLGHPHISSAPSSSSSTKFQQPQQQQQKQPFHQTQHFFSNQFAAQSSQANAAAATANYYQQQQQQQQRRQSEQHSQQHSQQSQQQQQQNSTSTGVLGLCQSSATLASSSPTSDPAKAAVGGVKGAQGGSILQHNTQYAASSMTQQHLLMPSAFPYIHTMSSSVSVKPAADPKAAPGSDLKPEKR